MNKITLINGDVTMSLTRFHDNFFDSCITDPPYELGFMGKSWDKTGIAYDIEMWQEVYRVMKPGAFLLAFGGSRTYHRLACAIEDAGFQIRDQIMWLYGSGVPKSLDIGKAIDKAAGVKREVVGIYCGNSDGLFMKGKDVMKVTAPATELARQWDGWGTGLKPAHEPIVVARKPPEGSVFKNVLKWGCGAVNVKGCAVDFAGTEDELESKIKNRHGDFKSGCRTNNIFGLYDKDRQNYDPPGRWPANVIHDGSLEVLAEFEKQSSSMGLHSAGSAQPPQDKWKRESYSGVTNWGAGKPCGSRKGDSGSAARFFYCAKASPAERNLGCEGLPLHECRYGNNFSSSGKGSISGSKRPSSNNHPTVKPLALMAYLVRLVTPPGGVVLDPFMGSGSTLIAAAKEGFDSFGIDKEWGYLQIASARIEGALGMLVKILRADCPDGDEKEATCATD